MARAQYGFFHVAWHRTAWTDPLDNSAMPASTSSMVAQTSSEAPASRKNSEDDQSMSVVDLPVPPMSLFERELVALRRNVEKELITGLREQLHNAFLQAVADFPDFDGTDNIRVHMVAGDATNSRQTTGDPTADPRRLSRTSKSTGQSTADTFEVYSCKPPDYYAPNQVPNKSDDDVHADAGSADVHADVDADDLRGPDDVRGPDDLRGPDDELRGPDDELRCPDDVLGPDDELRY